MLRRLDVVSNKPAPSSFKAGAAMVRGRLVQKNLTTGTVGLPTSAEGLHFVTKDSYPIGLMSLEGDLSDYDTRFEAIASGELVVLEKPMSGERYATTEFVATSLTTGCYVTVETTVGADQGKIKYSSTATPYKYGGAFTDNGHTLAIVEVL